ncbi:unnamed protein product [Adineta steineri]|uniref:Uncharacterized protein n=1 Tax=Adineta steineri TaxID=433720 RepID=A0A815DSL7_9BILA|nr:unnamed protein product [Adineta steineri]CAF1575461.1 unnamed protein product [Adineta steineri]
MMAPLPLNTVISLHGSSSIYPVYRRRFYVLFIFSFLAFNQCLFWLTFSPISKSTQIYYHIDESTVNLLLNWGPIIFIPCLPLAYVLLNKQHGLRKTVLLLAITDFIAISLRIMPTILISPSNSYFTSISLLFIHIGQILNAACGPLVMAPVSQLSCLWFAPDERTRATTLAIMACSLGSTIGFLITPWIVTKSEHVPYLLQLHFILAFCALVLTLIYFPAHPPHAPSVSAQSLIDMSMNEQNENSLRSYLNDIWRCFDSPSFKLLCSVGGISGGVFAAWTGLFSNILAAENFTEQQSGWFGFTCSLSTIIGGLITSTLADTRYFRRSFKSIILTMLCGCFLAVLYFQLSIHTIFFDEPIFKPTVTSIALSVTFAGLFQGSAIPLVYESLAEIMFPKPESLSASVLVLLNNVTALIILFIPPSLYKLLNFLVLFSIGLCTVLMMYVNIDYKRRNIDERKQ